MEKPEVVRKIWVSAGGQPVKDVWNYNIIEQLDLISKLRRSFPYVFIDTEFPGFLRSTPRGASEEDCYRDVKFNVDNLKLVQLGVTLTDGSTSFSWQFNFADFDPEVDACSQASVQFLKKHGIDFRRNRMQGVEAHVLSALLFKYLIGGCNGTRWISFHGIYDFAYLIKLIYRTPLPNTLSSFLQLVSNLFGSVYDVKHMARACDVPSFGKVGLVQLAKMLEIDDAWTEKSHQAGYDSLLTSMVFWALKLKFCDFNEDAHKGLLYGIEKHGLEEKKNAAMRCNSAEAMPYNAVCAEPVLDINAALAVCYVQQYAVVYGPAEPSYPAEPCCIGYGYALVPRHFMFKNIN